MLTCADTAALLKGWDNILILCHASPDGDTLGSAAALVRGLLSLGKKARLVCADVPAPKYNRLFLDMPSLEFEPEHVMAVDVADLPLLGSLQEAYRGKIELAVDHHGSHRHFADALWLDAESAATAEMIWQLLKEMGVSIDAAMADCVYTGVSTDTGCFRYRSTTVRTHRIAAETIEMGADAGEINQIMFESKSRAQVEAERLALDSMKLFCGGKCAMILVPQALYEKTGATESDLQGVASMPRQIEGVVLGVTMKEKENGEVKASVRSNPPADASALCGRFGGGGHVGAAGCSFSGLSIEEAAEKMMAACTAYLEELGL